LAASIIAGGATKRGIEAVPPWPLREARGVWVASVANVDWPSRPGLSGAQQQSELLAILDRAVQWRLNIVVLQVRPSCDALYASSLEPWSEFLTGHMGQAPEPYYDPLRFAVEEAHRRGLELHAWFNPFRLRVANAKSGVASNYLGRLHPEFVRHYGPQVWLDPGLPAVQEHTRRVILDVVRRYDIDGVHLDDYFYPYPEKNASGEHLEFPDEPSWHAYLSRGGKLSRADWRRQNIDGFVERLYRDIKAEKRWVKMGISPFGIWRPGYPRQVKKGLDAYESLYADSRKWLAQGWLDYFVPQLYWAAAGPERSYPALLDWWTGQNAKGRQIWAGNDATKVGTAWPAEEIVNQVRLTRRQRGATGNVFWNASSLMRNTDAVADLLGRLVYSQPALVPASGWLDDAQPGKPRFTALRNGDPHPASVSWTDAGPQPAWLWLCQTRSRGRWASTILPRDHTSYGLPPPASPGYPDTVAVTAINRCGRAGPTAILKLQFR
jgi:uncharacterized lipoprotein YddW (UPF0748 family)